MFWTDAFAITPELFAALRLALGSERTEHYRLRMADPTGDVIAVLVQEVESLKAQIEELKK